VCTDEPNLQCVQKRKALPEMVAGVVDALELGSPLVLNNRSLFVAAEGHVFLSCDYRQMELRLLAHFTQEAKLLAAFRDHGDPFTTLARMWLGGADGSVTEPQRERTKVCCYAIVYGSGVGNLAESLEVSKEQAAEIMRSFREEFPGIFAWIEQQKERLKHDGYIETIAGRRRYFPGIVGDKGDEEPGERKAETERAIERRAINAIVQGSAADVVKEAILLFEQQRSRCEATRRTELVLELHDELVLEVQEDAAEAVARRLVRCMEAVGLRHQLSLGLGVRVKHGARWGELTDYEGLAME